MAHPGGAPEPEKLTPPADANAATQKDNVSAGSADYQRATEPDPTSASSYANRAQFRKAIGDLDGALADYNRAIELDPKSAATYNNRADLFFATRKWGAALGDYNRFFELSKEDQEYPRLYVWLIRARTGQTDAANKELTAYLQQRGSTADWFSTVASYLLGRISDADCYWPL